MRFASVLFDVDSTLVSIEGVDWLAQLRGPDIAVTIEELTQRAMDGAVPLDSVYEARLDAIKPTRRELVELSHAYCAAVQPGARELCQRLLDDGADVQLISGGLRDALLPLAQLLGLSDAAVHAVRIEFDTSGAYAGVAVQQPLTRQSGKVEVVRALHLQHPVAMVGDGATDAATQSVVDTFIAYTGVVRRDAVVAIAHAEAGSMREVARILYDS